FSSLAHRFLNSFPTRRSSDLILGGLTVRLLQPPWVSSAHAAVGQTFFCIATVIALFTGRRWAEEVPRVELDTRKPSLITLTLLSDRKSTRLNSSHGSISYAVF